MGLNLVIACHKHKVRRWMFRNGEDGIRSFYHEHWRCNLDQYGTVVLSDDQSSDPWLTDNSYVEELYPQSETGPDSERFKNRVREIHAELIKQSTKPHYIEEAKSE